MLLDEMDVIEEYTQSEADRVIQDEYNTFKKTASGINVYHDRHQEMQQNDSRYGNATKDTGNSRLRLLNMLW